MTQDTDDEAGTPIATAGHVIYTDRDTLDRLRSELTEARLDKTVSGKSTPTIFGKHPVYGDVALSVVDKPAAHPNQPSYMMIIMTNDDRLAATARTKLERPWS